ncbi:AzlC family ABC transporter permease [Pectinatus brassicae]|uniref:4-azaleucine resistance transporter AzlC n=1 Tax=Pectinatus brassicae TaxID=862415 RepID=A0A840UKN3_9FIRM|nr:AzlC family ABC transporter permease [Pectinatus brassicae]MBB5336247.1 4-azaleucine resistance transporter AzlC [Pectinatus brassicae]
MSVQKAAFRAALPHTLPILAGFLFLGISYGFLMISKGFLPLYPIFMSMFIFAGSMEFVTMGLLLTTFNPLAAFILTLTVNARHIFYGISMLDKFKHMGKKKLYLIFGMCDESFAINYATRVPNGIDKDWFMFFVTLLNHIYWVGGATIGAILGKYIHIDTTGIDFVMAALFIVIFLEQWLQNAQHSFSLLGLFISGCCLLLFNDNFIIPAMICIVVSFLLLKKVKEVKADAVN